MERSPDSAEYEWFQQVSIDGPELEVFLQRSVHKNGSIEEGWTSDTETYFARYIYPNGRYAIGFFKDY